MDITKTLLFKPIPMDQLEQIVAQKPRDAVWQELLLPGDVALLTCQWKVGKTTLITGLLRALGQGVPFLQRSTKATTVWVVSEESQEQSLAANR